MNSKVLVRYHEIALKLSNRKWFEEALVRNLKKFLIAEIPEHSIDVTREPGRILIHHPLNHAIETILKRTFGVYSFSSIQAVPSNKESIITGIFEHFSTELKNSKTFRVSTRRSAKKIVDSSMQLDREVGALVQESFPDIRVHLKHPELVLGIEINHRETYLWAQKILGPGGLPVGTNGHLLTLLSGGIDSPVAAIMGLKRGAKTSFLHFYGTPFIGVEALHKAEDLVRLVNKYQAVKMPLFVCEFGNIQKIIATTTKPAFRTVIYRRFMFRIAAQLSKTIKALGLITGESLGQVASQTLENLKIIDSCIENLVLRPLIALDKDEIITLAKKYGTYERGILPTEDCCTLFADRTPSVWTRNQDILDEESKLGISDLVQMGYDSIRKSQNI